ncbi:MAG: phosphoenolpyruvate--protein phosphotransferase [Deltaproteobacteria bacterium]|nr:phosphoenolpyruvate--protein phosphotransferase [Deltaproteobacteria bacterium]MBW2396892.1 phosphoenolpyruvate--protein phosphotransferase [Deltaproteobacteria bacterium]
MDLVAKRLDADVCSVYLTETDLRHMLLQATIGLDRSAIGRVRLPPGEGLVGHVANEGRPIAFTDAQGHDAYRYFPETGEERYASLAAAPLIVRGSEGDRGLTIGVLVVQTLDEREFSQDDLGLLDTCARLLAPVVMNSQLLALVSGSADDRARITAELGEAGLHPPVNAGETERGVEILGIPTSRGIAIGPVHFLDDVVDLDRIDYTPNPDPEVEWADLSGALEEARRELDGLRGDLGDRFGAEFGAIFNTHIQMLEDKGFVAKLEAAVRNTGSALAALRHVLEEYAQMFASIEDPYFKERGSDVQEVGQRVISRLLGLRHQAAQLGEGSVVVASNLLPAHFALLDPEKVTAIVSEHGGPTSHGAIFARALEIPAVTGAAGVLEAVRSGEEVIVDGDSGRVILSPDESLRTEYQRAQQRAQVALEHLDAVADRPAETWDGHRVRLTANVGLLSDLRLCERHGAEGIGLFRTELLALVHRGFPSEDEQQQLYLGAAEAMSPRPVTIRTLDLGGDKAIPNLEVEGEENPQLGWRSIRLSLSHLDSFRAQLRAILRASAVGNVRILLPMVSQIGELRRVHEIIDETKHELRSREVAFDENVPVGIMIEVPAAAVTAEVLARECDFFSIGTNDLTQYTLAVDRGNERVAHLYDPLHPAVLCLIDHSVRAAGRVGIPISLCGEMANDPLAVPILVGMGLGELSGVASAIPVVKEIVRALDMGDAVTDARQALEAESPAEVHAIGARRLETAGLLDHPDIGDWLRRSIERS